MLHDVLNKQMNYTYAYIHNKYTSVISISLSSCLRQIVQYLVGRDSAGDLLLAAEVGACPVEGRGQLHDSVHPTLLISGAHVKVVRLKTKLCTVCIIYKGLSK